MPTREIRHPLIRHKIGLMRRADISTKNFRGLAQEVGYYSADGSLWPR